MISRSEWRAEDIPGNLARAAAMLTQNERRLIYHLAKKSWRPGGYLVDAGAFLGGSSIALASAVPEAPDDTVHAYDLFRVDVPGGHSARRFINDKLGIELVQDSFRYIYDHQTQPYQSIIEVHEGSILDQTWPEDKRIDVLFLDLCKTPELTAHVMRIFFPSLSVGSHLIHQDFYFWFEPSIHITSWILRDKLTRYANEAPSQGFQVRERISAARVDSAIEQIGCFETANTAMLQTIEYCEADNHRLQIEIARLILLKRLGREDAMSAELSRIRRQYQKLGWVDDLIKLTGSRLSERHSAVTP